MMSKSKILVVEKDENLGELLQKILINEGYDIDVAEKPEEALQYLSEKKFNLILTEIRLPNTQDGFEFIGNIKKLYPFTPIIVIAASGLVEDYLMAMNLGASDFINKPFHPSRLILTVNRALETKTLIESVKDRGKGKEIEQLLSEEKKASIEEIKGLLRRGKGNPFVSKTGIEPRIFGGRDKELNFFESKLDEAISHYSDHFLVLGGWGVGKSTLLKEFKKKAQDKGYATSLIEVEPFQQGSKVKEGILSLIQGIYSDLPFTIDRMKSLEKYLKSIGIQILGTGFSFDTTQPLELQPQALMLDTLINLWNDLKEKKLVVILMDDVQYFEPILEILTTLKQTLSSRRIQKDTKYLFIMSCTPDKWYKFINQEPHHPVGRYFMSKIDLLPLSREELKDIVLRSLEETGIKFEEDIIESVFYYTSGHPFEMQVLCSNLYDFQMSGLVDSSVWEKALHKTLKDLGDAIFKSWFDQASENEKRILKILAKYSEPVAIKNLKAMTKDVDSTLVKSVEKYLQRLFEKNLLNRTERGVYNIPDKMFQAYITHFEI